MIVLALDISQRCTGYAHDYPGDAGRPYAGVFRAPRAVGSAEEGWDYGATFLAYEEWLDALVATVAPGICAFEAPLNVVGSHRSSRPTSQTTVRILFGLAAFTEKVLKKRKVRSYEANLSTVKKHFAGHGRAEKADMLARCRQLGWSVPNADAADAAAVWSYMKAISDKSWRPSAALFSRGAA